MLALLLFLAQVNIRVTGAAPNGVVTFERKDTITGNRAAVGKFTVSGGVIDITLRSNTGVYANTQYEVTFRNSVGTVLTFELWTLPATPLTTTRDTVKSGEIVGNAQAAALNFIQEVPGGAMNGSNKVFTLSKMPITDPMVTLNGLIRARALDYNIANKTLTFTILAPDADSVLRVFYFY